MKRSRKPPRSIQKVRLRQVRDGRVRFPAERVSSPREVYEAVLPYYRQADREILSVLCLDAQRIRRLRASLCLAAWLIRVLETTSVPL
jgi:hypothetical protein